MSIGGAEPPAVEQAGERVALGRVQHRRRDGVPARVELLSQRVPVEGVEFKHLPATRGSAPA